MINIEDLNLIPCQDKSKLPSMPWKEYQTKKYTETITCTNRAVILGQTSEGVVVIDIDSSKPANFLFLHRIGPYSHSYIALYVLCHICMSLLLRTFADMVQITDILQIYRLQMAVHL